MTGHENVSKNVIKAVALMKEMKLHMDKLDKMITQPDRTCDQAFWDALRDMRECAEDLGDAVEVAWCSKQEECDVANP